MSSKENLWRGDPLDFIIKGISNIPASDRRGHRTYVKPIQEKYGASLSVETANLLEQLHNSIDGTALIRSIRQEGLHAADDYAHLTEPYEQVDPDDADLSTVMDIIDVKLHDAYCSREKDAAKVTSKNERSTIYVPELIERAGDGDVYMAKTLSSAKKIRIAWDLDDENQVVVVDNYEKWERLLGWKKLKSLPHGKNKIREELGDQLSDDVLEVVAPDEKDASDSSDDSSDGSSRGRKTRTKPSEEVLNVARGSRLNMRRKMKAEDIADTFDDDETLFVHNVSVLILFPSTTTYNMTDHWWIPGKIHGTGESAAIANCNKGTFQYLNQYDNVWHVDDYMNQARDYEFDSNIGTVSLNDVPTGNVVFHMLTHDSREYMMRPDVIGDLPEVIPSYAEDELYSPPDFPDSDDMVYAPITQEELFWLRPALREEVAKDDGATLLYADTSIRDIPKKYNLSSDYKLYARARLNDWDFDEIPELKNLDSASFYLDLDDGGFEIVETLAKLHDNGGDPYSQSPQARWFE